MKINTRNSSAKHTTAHIVQYIKKGNKKWAKDLIEYFSEEGIQMGIKHMKRCITNYKSKANRKPNEVSPHAFQSGHLKKSPTVNTADVVEGRKPSCTLTGNVNQFMH